MMRSSRWWLVCAAGLGFSACGGGGDGDDGAPASGGGTGDAGAPEGPNPAAAGLVSVKITPSNPLLEPGRAFRFRATGTYDDGEDKDVTQDAVWTSSNPEIISFSDVEGEGGRAMVHARGGATLTARVGDIRGELQLGGADGCVYPDFDLRLSLDATIPPMYWDNAYVGGRKTRFSLEEWACDEDVSVIVMVLGTAWCGACTGYAMRLEAEAAAFEAAGGRFVLVELEDADGQPADTEAAQRHLANVIGTNHGVRVGDLDTRPGERFLTNYADLGGLPTVYFVRRSDMKVIATGDTVGDRSLVDVAMDPDADWKNPPPPPFENRCPAGTDEAGEPNDLPAQATPLSVGTLQGGVCDESGDVYAIDEAGGWTFKVDFQHAVGDLDLAVWDPDTNEPLRVNGDIIGSAGATGTEVFSHTGPALVKVFGFRRASAPYTLTFSTP